MIQFVTIATITSDILNVIRGGILTQSEPISRRQIEAWIHQYRALLLKREWDKKKYISPDWTQSLQALELEEVDEAKGTTVNTDYKTFRTKLELPKTISYNWGSGFTYVGTITGLEIQFGSEAKSRWQEYKKYTSNDRIAYLKNGHLYITNDKELRYIDIKGLFEIPSEVSHLDNPKESITDVTENSPYPIPITMVPTLKQMILQGELGIMIQAPSDKVNDSDSKVESNISGEVKHTNKLN